MILSDAGLRGGVLAAVGWLAFASMSLGADQPQLFRLFSAAFSSASDEKVALPPQWMDDMVLQRDVPIPISGKAEPNKEVTVLFGDQTKVATADREGNWQVTLDPLPPSAEPRDLRVIPGCMKCSKELHNLLVGDVWLCGGREIAPWPKGGAGEAPVIRVWKLPSPAAGSSPFSTGWQKCTVEMSAQLPQLYRAFADTLQAEQSVPIGLIDCGSGSTDDAGLPLPANLTQLVPFPIRGVLWSAGQMTPENHGKSDWAAEVQSWRKRSGQPDLSFLLFAPRAAQSASNSPGIAQSSPAAYRLFVEIAGENATAEGARLAQEALKIEAGRKGPVLE